MAGVCSKEKILPHEIGDIDDHSHLLIQLPPTLSFIGCHSGNQSQFLPLNGERVLPGSAALPISVPVSRLRRSKFLTHLTHGVAVG